MPTVGWSSAKYGYDYLRSHGEKSVAANQCQLRHAILFFVTQRGTVPLYLAYCVNNRQCIGYFLLYKKN